jgi:UDP-galactopyranose mutase
MALEINMQDMLNNIDCIVCGSGFCGSTIVRKLAENGINVHRYGPHIFHTSDENIFEFINKFDKWNTYIAQSRVEKYNT